MSENKPLLTDYEKEIKREEALNIEILSAIHNFTKLNIGTILSDVSQMEFLALYMISDRGETFNSDKYMNVSAIAALLSVSIPGVSRLLKVLEEKGMVERVTDRTNRRNTYVCLTEKGGKVVEKDIKTIIEFSRRVTKRIGISKLNRLCKLSEELGYVVQEELANYSSGSM